MVLLILAVGGLSATPIVAAPGLAIAALLVIDVERLKNHMRREQHSQATTIHRDAEWSPFTRLVAAAVARTVPFYALLAFVPIYAVRHLGASHDVAASRSR